MTAAFNLSKLAYYASVHYQSTPDFVSSLIGDAISLKERINCLKKLQKPKKCYTSTTLVGAGQSFTALILDLLICTPLPSILCPKNVTSF